MDKPNSDLKLHLGCGENYLDGYVNIDYPPSEHTVQKKRVADQFSDISQLKFDRGAVSEVRLHHVFEHFRRPQISAMVVCWNRWLNFGGRVHIEVPDLGRMARAFLNPFASTKERAVAERHLFGSHEAAWAAHYEGYDEHLLRSLVETFGFEVEKVQRQHWRGTDNIHVYASKKHEITTPTQAASLGEKYLHQFLVDESAGELELLRVWMKEFDQQLQLGWAS